MRVGESAIVTAVMLALFALMMTGGYWLRHDRAVWDDICWVECRP